MSIATRVVNDEALRTAIRAFAPQQAEGIEFLYVLLDDSMRKGYEQGRADEAGQNEVERDNAWDQGYLQGVGDARANPGKADNIVQDIIFDQAELANDGKTYSGDEEIVANWQAYRESVRD